MYQEERDEIERLKDLVITLFRHNNYNSDHLREGIQRFWLRGRVYWLQTKQFGFKLKLLSPDTSFTVKPKVICSYRLCKRGESYKLKYKNLNNESEVLRALDLELKKN